MVDPRSEWRRVQLGLLLRGVGIDIRLGVEMMVMMLKPVIPSPAMVMEKLKQGRNRLDEPLNVMREAHERLGSQCDEG